jgi:hypothetical protein
MLKASAWLAAAFGVFLGLAEAAINWGHWQWWPLWVVDYICVALLLVGAWRALRGQGADVLLAGWAFTAGVFWMAYFITLEQQQGRAVAAEERQFAAAIGLLLAIAGAGLAGVLLSARGQGRTT